MHILTNCRQQFIQSYIHVSQCFMQMYTVYIFKEKLRWYIHIVSRYIVNSNSRVIVNIRIVSFLGLVFCLVAVNQRGPRGKEESCTDARYDCEIKRGCRDLL